MLGVPAVWGGVVRLQGPVGSHCCYCWRHPPIEVLLGRLVQPTEHQVRLMIPIVLTLLYRLCCAHSFYLLLTCRCAQSQGKLVQKPDQCRGMCFYQVMFDVFCDVWCTVLCMASHPFWSGQTLESNAPVSPSLLRIYWIPLHIVLESY